MLDQQHHEAFRWNEIVATVAASLLIAGMMACVGVSLRELGTRLSPAWDGSFLPWMCLIVALESIFSEGRVRHMSFVSYGRIAYRVSEFILLTILLKIFLTFLRGENLLEALSLWQDDFPFSFFAGEFGGVWMVMAVVWAIAGVFAGQIYELVQDTELLRPGSEPQFFTSRRETRRRLAGQILFLGAVMVVLTAMSRADLQALWGDLLPVEAGAVNVLIYFLLAFILLSQGQFAVLRASWIWQRIPVTRPMAMGWLRYSLIFLGVLALLVLILPTGYSVSLLTLAKILFSFLFSVLYFIVFLLMLPILWLLNLLARQMSQEEPFENPFDNLFEPPPATEDVTPIATLPISEVIQSLLFWILFFLVCGYALVQYLRQNQELLERLRRIPGLRWLVDGLNAFLEWLRGATKTVTQMAAAGWERVRPQPRRGTGTTPWHLIRPNRLLPRERVMFYYLALVRRSGENGLPRGASQTPSEYAAALRRTFPDGEAEISEMTETFLEARYTEHNVEEKSAATVKQAWEKLRNLLRKVK